MSKIASQSFAASRRKKLKSFSAAACTSPKIPLAELSVKNLPVRTLADFFARSEAPVSIGPSGQGTSLSEKAVEAFSDSLKIPRSREGFSLFGRVGARVGYQYTYSAQKRYSIAASWARVALPPGSRLPAPVPLMMPSPQAHCRASKAYSLMLRASL